MNGQVIAVENAAVGTTGSGSPGNPSGGTTSGSGTALISGETAGTLRNNFSGWVGMQFTVGAAPLVVSSVGRLSVAGNSGSHAVKLVEVSTSRDVQGGAATVVSSSGSGAFVYSALAGPITLKANTAYDLLSQETAGGDQWYDVEPVTSSSDASIGGPVYFDGSSYVKGPGQPNQSFVPVSLLYTLGTGGGNSSSATNTPFLTVPAAGTLRNNYTGFLGMEIQIGSTPLTLTQLGRLFVAGNTGTHTVKLVDATTGSDVVGGSVTVSGGTAGQFTYAPLSPAVTLAANGLYSVVSSEAAGGDQWYDVETVAGSSAAQVLGPVYVDGTGAYVVGQNLPSQSYVPVNFMYASSGASSGGGTANGTALVTYFAQGSLRNNFSGNVGMEITVGASPLTVTQLGRVYAQGNAATHLLRIISASDGSVVASQNWTPSGTLNQISYVQLASPVTLSANASYYLFSQEVAGGDQWYDIGAVTLTSAATALGPAYTDSSNTLVLGTGLTGQSFVPVSFIYTTN